MLFNEPKLLKSFNSSPKPNHSVSFSALQRAEIAEIPARRAASRSAARRAGFSALQRAEIAEIHADRRGVPHNPAVSVLFNEPKLLKYNVTSVSSSACGACFSALQRAEIAEISSTMSTSVLNDIGFSALQRAEIAEMLLMIVLNESDPAFQCSSTSRNC